MINLHKSSAVLLLSALLLGCVQEVTPVHQRVITMHVDPNAFSAENDYKLRVAADSISALTNGSIRMDLIFDGKLEGGVISSILSSDPLAKYYEEVSKTPGRMIAAAPLNPDNTRSVVVLSDRISIEPEKFVTTIMHEFGHVIGLPDISNPNAIMANQTNLGVPDPTGWTDVDTSVCVSLGICHDKE